MSEKLSRVPIWFWMIGILCLLWNLVGVYIFYVQVTLPADVIADMPPDERALYENLPFWVIGCFALGVFGGTLGCLALIFKRVWAVHLFAASLFGVVVNHLYGFLVTKPYKVFGVSEIIMPIIVLTVATFLMWFSLSAKKKGWLV